MFVEYDLRMIQYRAKCVQTPLDEIWMSGKCASIVSRFLVLTIHAD